LRPLRTEMILRSTAKLQLLGMADFILYDSEASTKNKLCLHIVDWKRTNNVHKNINLSMFQLNTYAHLLETYYGGWSFDGYVYSTVYVSKLSLVVFSEDLTHVSEYNIQHKPATIHDMFLETSPLKT
jgi:hypothetical protein